jgi:hypothetical protein
VKQIGAVCHDGYPSCFYRDIEDDESLTITMDRWFDPAVVYGNETDPTHLWYGAFEYLKHHPLEEMSSTSKSLRAGGIDFAQRVAGELAELAGVLDGSHRHTTLEDDLLLEGSQALYWLALVAVEHDISWTALRPDRALDTATPDFSAGTAARLLAAEAESWKRSPSDVSAQQVHSSMSIVAQAVLAAGVEPMRLIERDLEDLRTKPYLTSYFES